MEKLKVFRSQVPLPLPSVSRTPEDAMSQCTILPTQEAVRSHRSISAQSSRAPHTLGEVQPSNLSVQGQHLAGRAVNGLPAELPWETMQAARMGPMDCGISRKALNAAASLHTEVHLPTSEVPSDTVR
eukprot:2619532-Amphidinium_carterae.1